MPSSDNSNALSVKYVSKSFTLKICSKIAFFKNYLFNSVFKGFGNVFNNFVSFVYFSFFINYSLKTSSSSRTITISS